MITSNGVLALNKFLVGANGDWAGTIAVGLLGTTATASTTTEMQYEIGRYPINLKSYIPTSASNKIVLKASIPQELILSAYEIGVFPTKVTNDIVIDHTPISDFSELSSTGSSAWALGAASATLDSTNTRIGGYSIRIDANSTASTSTGFLTSQSLGYLDGDYIDMLYYVASATTGTSSVTVTLSDGSYNWQASGTFAATASGNWGVVRMTTLTRPDLFSNQLTSASVKFDSSAGQISADHMKFVKNYTKMDEQKLASRTASTTAYFTKKYGQSLDIEYTLQVT